jgi:hypothetical protein
MVCALALCACSDSTAPTDEEPAAASASASATVVSAAGYVLPPPRPFDNNPLDLPSVPLSLEEGARVLAVPKRMLEHARAGTTMVLEPARVEGREGDDLVVRVRQGVPFPAHSAYVVVLERGRIGRGTPLVVVYRDAVRHAVARNVAHDRVVVRLTDGGHKLPDQKLDPEDVGMLTPGALTPGGYAVHKEGDGLEHVLLVSRGQHKDKKVRWLALGRAGEAKLIEESALSALPRPNHEPRTGDQVLAAFRGRMVSAEVRAVDAPGLYTVKRERAGEPLLVGPDSLMPNREAPKPSGPHPVRRSPPDEAPTP